MKPMLVILAAGMGSRYGGLKQMAPVGPHGEYLLDYSIYDAMRAGFGKLVFVIRHALEEPFKTRMGSRFAHRIDTTYAFQEQDTALNGFPLPPDRRKPWGTGHAILAAREVVQTPFAMINADDYYGLDSLASMARFLSGPEVSPRRYAMVGFTLRRTLSAHGSVARGICQLRDEHDLSHVSECAGIVRCGRGARYRDAHGCEQALTGDEIVSMNLWGFHPSIFTHLARDFEVFLRDSARRPDSEFIIPAVVDGLIQADRARVHVLRTNSTWFGVTYQQDSVQVRQKVMQLVEQGVYPELLWA